MGYYCTVPQCTSLAGKTKNVRFHGFPRDCTMAEKWNIILKRGKPYTKYSKVCSLHFTQADYNVTTMGQKKTLTKDAVPSQNLPKLNADGTVMVIRKSRTVKYREGKKENTEKPEKWVIPHQTPVGPEASINSTTELQESNLAYRLQTLNATANAISPQNQPVCPIPTTASPQNMARQLSHAISPENLSHAISPENLSHAMTPENLSHAMSPENLNTRPLPSPQDVDQKPKKDATMQTDPVVCDEDSQNYDTEKPFEEYYQKTKTEDYIPQTNEEYNNEAEKYALERKSHNGYEKLEYNKTVEYQKDMYRVSERYPNRDWYQNTYSDTAELLRNQQHNLQMLQDQHRVNENQNFFNENHIKQEIDVNGEEDKFLYERSKEQIDAGVYEEQRRVPPQHVQDQVQHVKQEPDSTHGCDSVMQPQGSPYYAANGHAVTSGYYEQISRPGPEDLIAKQNALAAHPHLWQNMKRPFFYSDNPHYNTAPFLHRYEDITRILQ